MIHYLIDAYNLIHQDKDLARELSKSPKDAAEKLFVMLAKFANYHSKKKFTLIFDGEPYDIHSPIDNLYIEGSGRLKADDIIKSYIQVAVNPKYYIVVSSDKEIINFAHLHSASYFLSEQFILELKMFNSKSIEETEFEVFNETQKNIKKEADPLLKFFNDNPLDPNTFEEIKHIDSLTQTSIQKKESPSKEKSKNELSAENEVSEEALMKLIKHFS